MRCGFKGASIIICCKDETIEEVTSTPTTRKSEQACQLIRALTTIHVTYYHHYGEGPVIGEFPHMSAIGE